MYSIDKSCLCLNYFGRMSDAVQLGHPRKWVTPEENPATEIYFITPNLADHPKKMTRTLRTLEKKNKILSF